MTLKKTLSIGGCFIIGVALMLSLVRPTFAGQVLITEAEAKLPPPKGAIATERRGILRGPKVEFVPPAGAIHSPTRLHVKFESFGGTKIDPDSVKVTYLRTPNVDLTPRLKPYIQAAGIDIPDAEFPQGEHMVRVDIKDSDGRPGMTSFVLKVTP
jgi:hypothetical protein